MPRFTPSWKYRELPRTHVTSGTSSMVHAPPSYECRGSGSPPTQAISASGPTTFVHGHHRCPRVTQLPAAGCQLAIANGIAQRSEYRSQRGTEQQTIARAGALHATCIHTSTTAPSIHRPSQRASLSRMWPSSPTPCPRIHRYSSSTARRPPPTRLREC